MVDQKISELGRINLDRQHDAAAPPSLATKLQTLVAGRRHGSI
jgi:hypothetical protein